MGTWQGTPPAKQCRLRPVTKAVIDVGSNSVLLTVADTSGGKTALLAETSRVTGLGTGTKSTGLIAEPGWSETLAALNEAFALARSHGASTIEALGTMALRIATNTPAFLAAAANQGTPVQVLGAEEEARLGFIGVASDPLFASEDRLTVIDPGGHSTELETAVRTGGTWNTLNRVSVPIGALALIEGPMSAETLGPQEILTASGQIDRLIGQEYTPHTAGTAVVLGATGTNLVTIRDEIAPWDAAKVHGQTLDYEEVSRAVSWLSTMSNADRARLVGLEPGREKTIHAGALILERFMQAVHVLGVTVSVRGWRHGYLQETM